MAKAMSTGIGLSLATVFADRIKAWAICEAAWTPSTNVTVCTATNTTGMLCVNKGLGTYAVAANATGFEISITSWATKASAIGTAAYVVGYSSVAGSTGVHFWTTCATQAIASTANNVSMGAFKIYISDVT